MATPFRKIYDQFLPHIKDYTLAQLYQKNPTVYNEQMKQLLILAINNYPNGDINLYSYDEILEEFIIDLSQNQISILGKLMAIEYLNPIILDETILKQSLNSKDYRSYSPANHLEILMKIKDSLNTDVNRIASRQSYNIDNIKKLFGNKDETL